MAWHGLFVARPTTNTPSQTNLVRGLPAIPISCTDRCQLSICEMGRGILGCRGSYALGLRAAAYEVVHPSSKGELTLFFRIKRRSESAVAQT